MPEKSPGQRLTGPCATVRLPPALNPVTPLTNGGYLWLVAAVVRPRQNSP